MKTAFCVGRPSCVMRYESQPDSQLIGASPCSLKNPHDSTACVLKPLGVLTFNSPWLIDLHVESHRMSTQHDFGFLVLALSRSF